MTAAAPAAAAGRTRPAKVLLSGQRPYHIRKRGAY
jgi:hypothetical protein